MKSADSWMGAAAAAGHLGVTRATLYAYVSRGFVRSQPASGSTRERMYARDDLDRLRRRTEERRAPDKATARALQWGLPVLESSITLIDGHRLFYRGFDAARLARTRTIQEVAALIWTGREDSAHAIDAMPAAGPPAARGSFVTRAHTLLASAAARDPAALDLRAGRVALTGWRALHLLTTAATGAETRGTIDAALARAWRVDGRGLDVLRAALILCADHELNASSFTARCVASTGSHPYAVVTAALAALEGPRHGGAGARVEAMLASMRGTRRLARAIDSRLRRGESIDGFGHPLYRQGDPRGAALLDMLRERYARSAECRHVQAFVNAAAAATRERPNVDFGLAAVTRVLNLPAGASLTLFAIGRAIGWIGHAIEQYATGHLIRPRAKYVGVAPAENERRVRR